MQLTRSQARVAFRAGGLKENGGAVEYVLGFFGKTVGAARKAYAKYVGEGVVVIRVTS